MVAYRRREYTIASVLVWMQVSNGLLPPQTNHGRSSPCCRRYKYRILFREATFPDECLTVFASGEDNNEIGSQWNPENDDDRVIIRGSEYDDIDGSIWEDLETGQPPKWLVMKEVSRRMATSCYRFNTKFHSFSMFVVLQDTKILSKPVSLMLR